VAGVSVPLTVELSACLIVSTPLISDTTEPALEPAVVPVAGAGLVSLPQRSCLICA
jgi:hypothetical protein